MADDSSEVRDGLIQQLESDRLLGARAVPVVPSAGAAKALAKLNAEQVVNCTKCSLCKTRTQTVFGVGNPAARLVFVGEAPGFEEDRLGIPFIGRAGDLLTRMIIAMGLKRDDVYICNVLKCRPPDNRDPSPEEITECSPYLFEQLTTIAPQVIVALGAPASRTLLNTDDTIGNLRGRFHDFRPTGASPDERPIPLMPTYHPAYLLRSPNQKPKTWSDLQMVMAHLGLKPPAR